MLLYYIRYNGSLSYRTNLANANALGIQHVHIFLDSGFWSEECLQKLSPGCDAFTVRMSSCLTEAERAVDQCRDDIERYANELPDYHIFCVEQPVTLYGVCGRILV